MPELVQALQLVSGALWLAVALFVSPRIKRSWHKDASRATVLAAPIGFLGWMQAGFTVRWLLWPHTMEAMNAAELTTWAALYAMSALLACWFFAGAIQTRND